MKYRTLKSPLSVQVEITDNCNETCSHCYRSCPSLAEKSGVALSPERAKYVIGEIIRAGVFSFSLTGGEPLLYPKSVKDAISEGKKAGLTCGVNTNLQPLTNQMADFFSENNVRVLTSLASVEPEMHERIVGLKGSHARLVRNIEKLTNMGVRVSVNMVVRKDNFWQVYETGKFAHTLGVSRFSATKAAPTVGIEYSTYSPSHEHLKSSLEDLLRLQAEYGMDVDILESYPLCFFGNVERYAHFARRNCTAGIYNCSIGPNGDVRPCSHSAHAYGNIFCENLEAIWGNMDQWRQAEY